MRRSGAFSALISAAVSGASSIACTALLGEFTTTNDTAEGGPGIPPGGCDATQKTCNGTCTSREDPSAGCATDSCARRSRSRAQGSRA